MKKVLVFLFFVVIIISRSFSDSIPVYDRSTWGNWIDSDKDGENTRIEVLNEERIMVQDGTYVWRCPYTNQSYSDPKYLDIDHVVPIYEAYISGGYLWSKEKKRDYYNYLSDPVHLRAVSLSSNRSKGDADPSVWMPKYNKCQYLYDWIEVKLRWGLTMDVKEHDFIFKFLKDSCSCK